MLRGTVLRDVDNEVLDRPMKVIGTCLQSVKRIPVVCSRNKQTRLPHSLCKEGSRTTL